MSSLILFFQVCTDTFTPGAVLQHLVIWITLELKSWRSLLTLKVNVSKEMIYHLIIQSILSNWQEFKLQYPIIYHGKLEKRSMESICHMYVWPLFIVDIRMSHYSFLESNHRLKEAKGHIYPNEVLIGVKSAAVLISISSSHGLILLPSPPHLGGRGRCSGLGSCVISTRVMCPLGYVAAPEDP